MSASLKALLDADWEWECQDNPEFASQAGAHDTAWPAPLQNVGPEQWEARQQHSAKMAAQLQALIDSGVLDKSELIFAKLVCAQHVDLVYNITNCPMYLFHLAHVPSIQF
jgi:hypothetical protein